MTAVLCNNYCVYKTLEDFDVSGQKPVFPFVVEVANFLFGNKRKIKDENERKRSCVWQGPVWRVLKQEGTVTETTLLLAHAGLACVQGSPGSPG